MTNTNTTRPELTDVLNEYGQHSCASDGAVAQGGSRKMKQCSACGNYVVFVQSRKTDKWYLADCFPKKNGGYYYVKASLHFKTCAESAERREEYRRIRNEGDVNLAATADLQAWVKENLANGVKITNEELDAKMAELLAAHRARVEGRV